MRNCLYKKGPLLFLFLAYLLPVCAEYSLVFIHIGDKAPSYTDTAIVQARLFNPEARIIFLSSTKALEDFTIRKTSHRIELCSYETLPKTRLHNLYQKKCIETSPFWRYTSERFLYLWDLLKAYSLENVFHLENDIMLYADLQTLLPIFQQKYPGIGATFDNDDRCIPGFLWIANEKAMESLASYFTKQASKQVSDMYVIGKYRKTYPKNWIDRLPIIMPEYTSFYSLQSLSRQGTSEPEGYSNHTNYFSAIFDAAALGQFFGGIDPIHQNHEPGFINESCLFNPSLLEYRWIPDEKGRVCPYAIFQKKPYKIINLHIHSKKLHQFKSYLTLP